MSGRLCLAGVVRIEDGTGERCLAGAQPRLVLVRTALDPGRPFSVDQLACTLWPEGLGRHWEGALRGVVTKIRAFLGDDATLENSGHCYRFVGKSLEVDIARATEAVHCAEARLAEQDNGAAASLADDAATLLADSLLPGVDADWLSPWRAKSEALRGRAIRVAALAHSAGGHHDDAVDRARAGVALDPFDEQSHRVLVQVHVAAGNRGAALRDYERLRRLLVDELGITPDPESQALHDAIVAGGARSYGSRGVPAASRSAEPARSPSGPATESTELRRLLRAWAADPRPG